jgi:hypothetical protein
MGGTRFSDKYGTVRITRSEHDELAGKIVDGLQQIGISAEFIPYLYDKQSFGDIDILCKKSATHANLPESLQDRPLALEARDNRIIAQLGAEYGHRGELANPGLSMIFQGREGHVQVDLVSIEDDVYDIAKRHLSWGDAGSMSSVVGRQMGLKIGMTGIHLNILMYGKHVRIPVPMTYNEVLEFQGYDSSVHERGFSNNLEIYEWICAGRYFDPRIWELDRITNKSRQRALKREAYLNFLEYNRHNNKLAAYQWGDRGEREDEWRNLIVSSFPTVKAEIERNEEERQKHLESKSIFSGKVISEVTGLTGDALSHFMNNIKKAKGEELEVYISEKDHASVKKVIHEYFHTL